jgi:NitT/TauT family transport system substrate-binding protein
VGNPSSNKSLSEKRAQAVADYLIRNHGFDPNRITVIGNGQDKPVAENTTEEGRKKNRRTDFELIPQ